MKLTLAAGLLAGLALFAPQDDTRTPDSQTQETPTMELGNFSVSLAVKDLAASRAFYEKLGFRTKHDMAEHNYVILQNDTATIGLFQGMFENNILTFNPGWDRDAEALESFTDVRELQQRIKAAGITPVTEADEDSTDVASFVVVDPDGNAILVDQHVPKPEK